MRGLEARHRKADVLRRQLRGIANVAGQEPACEWAERDKGDIQLAVNRARELAPGKPVEVECDNLDQVKAAIEARADVIMLDNMSLPKLREAVRLIDGRAVTEASGGVNLQTVRQIAETGVDWISVGALTHSAKALDLALDFE